MAKSDSAFYPHDEANLKLAKAKAIIEGLIERFCTEDEKVEHTPWINTLWVAQDLIDDATELMEKFVKAVEPHLPDPCLGADPGKPSTDP